MDWEGKDFETNRWAFIAVYDTSDYGARISVVSNDEKVCENVKYLNSILATVPL